MLILWRTLLLLYILEHDPSRGKTNNTTKNNERHNSYAAVANPNTDTLFETFFLHTLKGSIDIDIGIDERELSFFFQECDRSGGSGPQHEVCFVRLQVLCEL